MRTVDVVEAKRRLSRLVVEAARGRAFIISKAGKPMVKVIALDKPKGVKRLGFLEGAFAVPADFDEIGRAEIERRFDSNEVKAADPIVAKYPGAIRRV